MNPAVSVIMPAFNRLPWLCEAIDSVVAQTFKDWELIIADDGSDATTREYLRSLEVQMGPRLRALLLEHRGNPPAVRNAALRQAAGEYVAFLDSDDVWLPGKLEAQLSSLQRRARCEWSYTRCTLIDAAREPFSAARALRYPAAPRGWILDSLLKGEAAVVQSSVVVHRDAIAAVGGYPEDLPICGDYELYVQLARRSEIDFIDEPLVLVRRHAQHYCSDAAAVAELRRFLERTRRAGIAPHMDGVLRRRSARLRLEQIMRSIRP